MNDTPRVKQLAAAIAYEILDDRRFRAALREIVVRTAVELDELATTGKLRSFLRTVESKGMRLYLTDTGELRCRNASRLSTDLKAVLIVYRNEIVRLLERERELERKTKPPDVSTKTPAPKP